MEAQLPVIEVYLQPVAGKLGFAVEKTVNASAADTVRKVGVADMIGDIGDQRIEVEPQTARLPERACKQRMRKVQIESRTHVPSYSCRDCVCGFAMSRAFLCRVEVVPAILQVEKWAT